jgi:hypothetical protein
MIRDSIQTIVALGFTCGTVMACSSDVPSEPISRVQTVVAAAAKDAGAVGRAKTKQIGDPCHPKDGWTPARAPRASDANQSSVPALHPPPPGPDYDDLPPGLDYCSLNLHSVAGPRGYWTRSCSTDADCPAASACVGEKVCMKVCSSDDECPPWAPECTGTPPTCTYLPDRFETDPVFTSPPNPAGRQGKVIQAR